MISTKEFFKNILNNPIIPCMTYFDRTTEKIEVCDSIRDIKDRLTAGEVILFPYEDELYSHSEALRDFLLENNIIVPRGEKVMVYLRECKRHYDFYAFKDAGVKEKLLRWMELNEIPTTIIY
ncbi:hypothetical protein H6A64_07900 [Lacrimispora saccharolytica]|nr:hypothetical protein [Lacrimispora saccharolytica]